MADLTGVPGAIRTHGPKIRNLVLYPAELRGHTSVIYRINHRKRSPKHVQRFAMRMGRPPGCSVR